MLREDSRTLMDSIFSTDSPKMLQQLLLVLRTLMDTEARRGQSSNAKTGSIDGQVDRAILTGTAEELGHAGISGSVMQTYLDRVLNVLTRKAPALRALAFEVLERTLEQGLVMPAIVSEFAVSLDVPLEFYAPSRLLVAVHPCSRRR